MITPAQHVMTRNLLAIPAGTTAFQALKLMSEKRIRHLPVIDSHDEIIGIISDRDLQAVVQPDSTPVEIIMRSPVQFVEKDTPLRQAIFKMLQGKFSCLLVSDVDDMAIGIITTDDLLWYLAHLLGDEKEDTTPILNVKAQQTIGEVAEKLSLMGL